MLPIPPNNLAFDQVSLCFVRMLPGDRTKGLVPAYYFRILAADGAVAGHINFRIGDTPHVRICAGHIGFEVNPPFRGRHFALHACRAIAPLVRQLYPAVIITCDPDNLASRRTIEALGARFLEQVPVPPDDPHYARGSREKRRYEWTP
jgi:tagatose 1,6-diphosphate aldolase